MPAAEQTRRLAPSRKAYRRYLVLAPFAGALATLRNVRRADMSWQWDVGIGVAAAVLLVAGATLWYRNARVWTDGTTLHRRTAFGRVRLVPHAEVASVFLAPNYRWANTPATGLLAFLDRDRRGLLRLHGYHWGEAQLRAFAHVTAAPVDQREDAIKARHVRPDHPGALMWIERHAVPFYWTMAVVLVLGLVALWIAVRAWASPSDPFGAPSERWIVQGIVGWRFGFGWWFGLG